LSAGALSTGGAADIEVVTASASETKRLTLAPGQRSFLAEIPLTQPIEAASVDVRVQVSGPGVQQSTDSIIATVAPGLSRPLMFRRGPSTGNRLQPAALPVFSRTERVRLETPIAPTWTSGPARLLDRVGQPLAIPITVAERVDTESAQRWVTADLALAPLAPGDYAVELAVSTPGGEQRTIIAIRVVR